MQDFEEIYNNYYSYVYTYLTYLKKQKRVTELPVDMVEEEDSIEHWIVDKETVMQIHQILHEIEEPYREVFWMRTFGEMSFAQIAKVHGKTESWARVTYHRAKMKIKEEMR